MYGLSQILSGQVDAANAVYHTNVEGFDIVFAGPYPPNPTELAGSAAFKEFLDSQRDNYDYIIIDAPPLGLVIDAAVMSSCCDGAVLVINIGHVKYRIAQGVKNQLEKSGCKILGVVLNQVDRKRTSFKGDQYYQSTYMSGTPLPREKARKTPDPMIVPQQHAPTAQAPRTARPTSSTPAPSPRAAQKPQTTTIRIDKKDH